MCSPTCGPLMTPFLSSALAFLPKSQHSPAPGLRALGAETGQQFACCNISPANLVPGSHTNCWGQRRNRNRTLAQFSRLDACISGVFSRLNPCSSRFYSPSFEDSKWGAHGLVSQEFWHWSASKTHAPLGPTSETCQREAGKTRCSKSNNIISIIKHTQELTVTNLFKFSAETSNPH